MSAEAITLLTLVGVVGFFLWGRIPVELVAFGATLLLYAFGVLTFPQAVAGFGDTAVILIGSLFIVSEGLDSSGVTTWVGDKMASQARAGYKKLLFLTMLLAAGLTSLIGLNGTVAALLPMVVVLSMRRSLPPSRLLMPLAFAGSAGGMLLLTGSPVNVVISDAAADAGVGSFGFAEFAYVGIPVTLGTFAIVMLFGSRLVPDRRSDELPPNLSAIAGKLVRSYSLDNVLHLWVEADSPLIGQPRSGWDLSGYLGVRIITVKPEGTEEATSDGTVEAGDRLTLVGDPDVGERFADDKRLRVGKVRTASDIELSLLSKYSGAAEVVVPPRSVHVGEHLEPSRVIDGGLIVLGISRGGEDTGPGITRIRPGDTLLLEGPWNALKAAERSHDLLVVDSPELIQRQNVPLGRGSRQAIVILIVMIILLATGVVPPALATLLAAFAMILFGVVTTSQAYRGVSWSTVFLVAGMIPVATAVTTSGAGEMVANILVEAVGDAGPTALLAAMFVITVAFSQLISNTATALVMIPIAVSAANQLDISARPVLMSLCVAAAVAFLTPVATPANLMVMGPAGYRFGDYWRLGLPLVLLFGVVAVFLVPLIWKF